MSRRQEIPSKNAELCSAHFEKAMIDATGQIIRLREGAVPSHRLVNVPECAEVSCNVI